jgi:hypothetical protein
MRERENTVPFDAYVRKIFTIFTGMILASLIISCAGPTATDTVPPELAIGPTATDTVFPKAGEEEVSEEPTATDAISSGLLIEYHRSGGFAGFDDYLTVDANRKVTLTRKAGHYEFVLDQKSFEQLLQQLDQAEFPSLEREYLPANTCCDLIEYIITYGGHTVQTMDTAVPESLQPILDSLNEMIKPG